MSIRVMTAVWAVNLPASEKLVLLALADCANDEGRCWPGLRSLCEKTGKCKRSLQESLRLLDKAGHITRTENPGKGMNYVVHPVAKPAPVEQSATGSKICTGGKTCREPVAKSAPKPSRTVIGRAREKSVHKISMSDNWQPEPFKSGKCKQIVESWSDDQLETEIEKFSAHHRRNGSRWSDWQAAWQTWVLNSVGFAVPQRWGTDPPKFSEVLMEERRKREAAESGSMRGNRC
jgi:hypothetical protein